MNAHVLDHCADHLRARVGEREAFEAKYGALAGTFLAELWPLFLLYRRLPFDFDLPVATRHLAGTAALYIAEHQDFVDDSADAGVGLIDDVYVAFAVLRPIVSGAKGVDLNRHWRGDTTLEDVLGLAHNLNALVEATPSKVVQNADKLLGIDK